MEDKIKNFLEKWNEMLEAANNIEEFKYEFKISVTSDNRLIHEREQLISGVNESFAKNNMHYNSSSRN
jgi:hypothetical protein